MNILGFRIRELRKKNNLTQAELGKIVNVGKSTISQYESGISNPDYETLAKLADFFSVPLDYLLGRADSYQINLIDILESDKLQVIAGENALTYQQKQELLYFLERPSSFAEHTYTIPVLGAIRAGIPLLSDANYDGELNIPSDIKADFALIVQGNSMAGAGICPGDFAICNKTEAAQNGNIVAAVHDVSSGFCEATLKYFFKSGDRIVLRAANPEFNDINLEKGYRIAGILTAIIRKHSVPYSHYQRLRFKAVF